jgi:AcrR family transcriptional regulator
MPRVIDASTAFRLQVAVFGAMYRASSEGSASGTPALYRKLRPRPNGPSREEVKANQRSRLHGATIEAMAKHGYTATSVAELCRLAGVSKRTFYEQFHNKEACFLSTYDRVMGCAIERIAAERRAKPGWEAGLRSVLRGLAHAVLDAPKAAHLALLEVLSAGPATLSRRDSTRQNIERLLLASFDEDAHGVALPPAVATGIVCGVERTVRGCLRDGRLGEIARLTDELTEWALTYGSPAVAALPAVASLAADRTTPAAPRPRARQGSGNMRIVRAAAEVAAEEGYGRLTAAKIARRAGISEAMFWDAYRSTEECFLDALDRVCLEALLASVRAARTAGDPLVGMHRGLTALLECIALDPVLRGVAFVEVFAAGPAAVECSERFIDRLLDLLTECLPSSRETPAVALEASSGALWGLVSDAALRESIDLRALANHASYLALAPLVGPEAALRAIASDGESTPEGVWETDRASARAG